jgi:hypothetical protein
VITPWPLYLRETTHPASCVPHRRFARFGEENKSLGTAGFESRFVCVRTRVTVNRYSRYSKDFFIRCHYLFVHCHPYVLFIHCHHCDWLVHSHPDVFFIHSHHCDLFIHCHHYLFIYCYHYEIHTQSSL